jgi:hypothetical protein
LILREKTPIAIIIYEMIIIRNEYTGTGAELWCCHLAASERAADVASEEVVEGLMGGGVGAAEFVEQYRKTRALYYARQQKRTDMEPKLRAYLPPW